MLMIHQLIYVNNYRTRIIDQLLIGTHRPITGLHTDHKRCKFCRWSKPQLEVPYGCQVIKYPNFYPNTKIVYGYRSFSPKKIIDIIDGLC